MSTFHSLYGGSSASRWCGDNPCPGSISAIHAMPKLPGGDYADEGTLAHEIAALELAGYPTEALKHSEMVKHAKDYRSYIERVVGVKMDRIREDTEKWHIGIEQRVGYPLCPPGTKLPPWQETRFGSGIVDCFVIDRETGKAWIFDLKYGSGVKVSAEDNLQLKTYAAGISSEYMAFSYSCHIFQPRMDNISSVEYTDEEITMHLLRIEEGFKASVAKNPVFSPSAENCKWCPAARNCEPAAHLVRDLVSEAEREKLKGLQWGENILSLLRQRKFIRGFLAEVEKQGIGTIELGGEIPGFFVGTARGRRQVTEAGEKRIVRKIGKRKAYTQRLKPLYTLKQLVGDKFLDKCCEVVEGSKRLEQIKEGHGHGDGYFGEKTDFEEDLSF